MNVRYLTTSFIGALVLAGCGGGGTTVTTPPTPAPPTPTPAPLVVTPSQIALGTPGATQTFTVSEGTMTGQFSSATADAASCTNVASVAPTSGTPNSYTVTAGTTAGICSITVSDGAAQKATVTVTLTLTQGSVQ